MIETQLACDDTWFPQTLAKYRSGSDEAGRKISGSCLRLAKQLAEDEAERRSGYTLVEFIGEANAGIVDALHGFSGSSATEFLLHAEECIRNRFLNL